MSTPSIEIALADDQALVRAGLRVLLEQEGIAVVLEAEEGEQLLAQLRERKVDVILCDIRMPGLDGIETVRKLRQQGDHTPVLLLTTFDDSEWLIQAAEAGAQGFLIKDIAPEDLTHAIRHVAGGGSLLQPVSTDPVRARYRFHDEKLPKDTFAKREIAILRLMAGGYSNKEIARCLFFAEGTVKNYVSTILEKLGTRDRTRAVLKAITLRII